MGTVAAHDTQTRLQVLQRSRAALRLDQIGMPVPIFQRVDAAMRAQRGLNQTTCDWYTRLTEHGGEDCH